jgi:UDP-2,3-diacylglucosamine pyrophosphatase LpxH/tetratricopeptide (TPR) repeat protein
MQVLKQDCFIYEIFILNRRSKLAILNIIHISDLHISSKEDPAFKRVRQELIKDIVHLKNKHKYEFDAIVMSGDSVDRGEIDSFPLVKEFFIDLCNASGLEINKVVFVPGNHDIVRKDYLLKAFHEEMKENPIFSKVRSLEFWEDLKPRFTPYYNFSSEYHKSNQSFYHGQLGGELVTIDNPKGSTQFILLNSSWTTNGAKDYGQLYVNRWQIEELIEKANQLPTPNMRIAVIHHPLDWLIKEEREFIEMTFHQNGSFPVQALMHGHIHDSKIRTTTTPDGSLHTLISGLGYPDSKTRENGQPKITGNRYAVYSFDLSNGHIKGLARVSRTGGQFVADTSLYSAGKDDGIFNIQAPLIQNKIINDQSTSVNDIEVDSVPLVSDWVGRENEMKRLLNPNLRAASITGIGGQGKTGLASAFFRKSAKSSDRSFDFGVWIDCREVPKTLHAKIIDSLEAISMGTEKTSLYAQESIDNTAKRFLGHLKSKKMLIVFDNIDSYIVKDSESTTHDFKPFVDVILNNEHESFIIFTCRDAFNDQRGSFRHIPLNGLMENEVKEFFRRREISLVDKNAEIYCEKLTELTLGHPWWLGLIAGQLVSGRDTLMSIVKRFWKDGASHDDRISEYFKDLWSGLQKDQQSLLRYMVNSPRPLTEDEVIQLLTYEYGPDKTIRTIRRLERAGLLEKHEGTQLGNMAYQVHPLMRQYIHKTYPKDKQKEYFERCLTFFLNNKKVIAFLFTNSTNSINLEDVSNESLSFKSLIDSLEACLVSRNFDLAYVLLGVYWKRLDREGQHHKFFSIACRVLDSISWTDIDVIKTPMRIELLGNLINQLGLSGDIEQRDLYINKIKQIIDPETPAYNPYLSILAHIEWQHNSNNVKALEYIHEIESLKEQSFEVWDMASLKGIILRDTGNLEAAAAIFEEKSATHETVYNIGNLAKTYLSQKKYDEAEQLLIKCIGKLSINGTYLHTTNLGYAYLWLSEVMKETNRERESVSFFILAKNVWVEHAPLLIPILEQIKTSFFLDVQLLDEMTLEEAEKCKNLYFQEKSL